MRKPAAMKVRKRRSKKSPQRRSATATPLSGGVARLARRREYLRCEFEMISDRLKNDDVYRKIGWHSEQINKTISREEYDKKMDVVRERLTRRLDAIRADPNFRPRGPQGG